MCRAHIDTIDHYSYEIGSRSPADGREQSLGGISITDFQADQSEAIGDGEMRFGIGNRTGSASLQNVDANIGGSVEFYVSAGIAQNGLVLKTCRYLPKKGGHDKYCRCKKE